MRFGLISLLLLLLPLPACAARTVTVEQLGRILAEAHGHSDARVSGDLSDLELTERLSAATLAHFEAEVPGPRSQEALLDLADASTFLPLATSEMLNQPPPDPAGLRKIIDNAIEYLGKTIPNMPNFLATRDTLHFEDSPWQEEIDNSRSVGGINTRSVSNAHITIGEPYSLAMYSAGRTLTEVTYRDGREVPATATASQRETERIGLTTKGEFGPILAIVVSDALHSKIYWDHWEPGTAGPVAVFRYTVLQSGSHYTVAYPSESGLKLISPAYHGLLAFDAATGAVLRLTIVADMQAPYQLVQVGIAVEYGPIRLGDKTYICPLHAVALSREPLAEEGQSVAAPLRTCLNDVSFTNYHLFHAEARILSATHGP
ncbi:MAG TPA: hypothetical protein VHX13_13320 [Acidobacteriaceae bacterium]|jgi:hypothetical protein|nr:hypothetical protein [Acidobacteriaceae bacterium]